MSWAEHSIRHLADHHQNSCPRTCSAGSTASTLISPYIDEEIEARLPFMWKTILDTRVLVAENLGAAPTPLVLAQLECYTSANQPRNGLVHTERETHDRHARRPAVARRGPEEDGPRRPH
jgi:hypothetical protein